MRLSQKAGRVEKIRPAFDPCAVHPMSDPGGSHHGIPVRCRIAASADTSARQSATFPMVSRCARHSDAHGSSRSTSRGNSVASLMLAMPHNRAVSRSRPSPSPP